MTQTPAFVPLPPVDAEVKVICCEYCPVACGYKVYLWPEGRDGGRAASENALGIDFPTDPLSGRWPSENMHTVIEQNGQQTNVIIIPDGDSDVVNVGGSHSVRGGALAKKLYTKNGLTSDRYLTPLLKVNGEHVPIPWDTAIELVARLSQYVLEEWDELAWGFKIYSYQFYENVFAGSKLALGEIGTPNFSAHHAPAAGDDVPGLSDTGVDAFGSAFVDDKAADVLFIVGSDPYETKTVRFTQWMQPGGATIIYVDPRKTFTANYAVQRGGLHLQLLPGTDTALLGAIAREIVANGWEDAEFIRDHMASADEIAAEGKWRRVRFGRSFEQYKEYLMAEHDFSPEGVEAATSVPYDKIRSAAEMMSGGGGGDRPKTMVLFEKGLYWSHNYENTAAIGSLGMLLGAVGREGRATSRLGGHQRGGQKAAGYPKDKSPHFFEDHPVEMDTERWLYEGKTRLRWIVGTNWISAMGASNALEAKVKELTTMGPEVTSTDVEAAYEALKERMDAGGTVIVHQEIYPNDSTPYADIILAAGAWGEDTYARNNSERRLRIYEKIMDPPGEALPDWKIFQAVAQKMGFEGFDWQDTNEIFEEAAAKSSGGRRNFAALVEKAGADGVRGHDLLATYGTQGLQTPLKLEGGELVETVRLHADMKFNTDSGKANFVFADWDAVKERNAILAPTGDEVWVLNGRVNALWNNLSDNLRREISKERWPTNFLEVNPQDAADWGLENGDQVAIESDSVLDFVGKKVTGRFEAAVYVSDIVPPGITFTYFMFPGNPANAVVSGDTSLQPLNLRNNFKLGKGTITKIGRSEYADVMSFVPRNLVP
ncbi:MAG: arsenate reductase (azurin) large subunit [Actinomycetota bacterium]|nr:arsenate reductase (azurin) large subunit [Actinomycetota bacterium]